MQKQRLGYFFIVMASVVIVLAGVKFAATIVVPFLLSLFIAIILSPTYSFFKSKGIVDMLSITIVMGVFLLFLALIAKLIGNSVHDFSANIDTYSLKLTAYYQALSQFGANFGIEIPVNEISSLVNSKELMRFFTSLIESLGSIFTNGFVVILTVVFMLLESKHFIAKIRYADSDAQTMEHINQIFTQIKSYMVIKALISLLTGFVVWIFLSFMGTDYAFLWGVLAFLFNFIPNIGSIIAAVPAVLITLVQFGGVSSLIVALFYIVINITIGSVLEPKVMGRGLGLSTLVVFLSLIFWGWLLGIVGMLLSIPLTIMAKIIFAASEETRWMAVLLGNGENLEEESRSKSVE
jgi:predicted PurR-regulated permease PerM